MKNSVWTTRTWILLAVTFLLVTAGILNFAQRLTHHSPPTDGIDWGQDAQGVYVKRVEPDSSAGQLRALGFAPGDRLIGIGTSEENLEQVAAAEDVQLYLDEARVGGSLYYLIERRNPQFPDNPFHFIIRVSDLRPMVELTARELYINIIGVIYLLVGLYVLFRQGGHAPFAFHFAVLCLTAFVFHFYQSTGSYRDLDKGVAFLDDAGLILFAPIFLHFCALYPVRQHLSERHRWLTLLLYAPAVLLLTLTALVFFVPPSRINFSANFIGWLYRADVLHLTVALVAGGALLAHRFWKSESAIVRQQLKWVVWGSVLAITPFTLLYAIGYIFEGGDASNLAVTLFGRRVVDASVLPLVLIPLTFGNSVVRYRLMDVDIVVRRAVVYALTTMALALMIGAALYGALQLVLGDQSVPSINTLNALVAVVALALITMTAAPLKNFLQERVDRFFYGEKYDLRNGLLEFGRTLSATTALDPLLDALVSRLQQVLNVERMAIFIEDERAPSGYRVARAVGLPKEIVVPPDFRASVRARAAETGVVRADELELENETANADGGKYMPRALHYFVPCVVRGRMVAVIGLGRSTGGALLSSEDLEILRTISGYVAIAIENSLLYQEQRRRAAELEALKEFNESIVESINIGLLAVDRRGCVTACNSALEAMLNLKREEAIGHRVEDLFAEDFAETLQQVLGEPGWELVELRNIYKLHTATRDGRSLILNIAIAPLRQNHLQSAPLENLPAHSGALVVLEDVTTRVQLEEQLQQREKLSSIGLLAAGVAHEINTPLTGVSSYTQMLLATMNANDPKHALLQKIKRQTDRATDIVTNLLNFSRTGSATEIVDVDINRVLDDTLQLLDPQMRQTQIEVVREYEKDLPAIYGNSGKLQQVFTNLILNARDAIVDGGKIFIRTAHNTEDETIAVEIEDTGIGIAPEHIARIYDPFFTTKGVGRGTGLGLAVTYGIVQEHGGHISVESAPGHGTRFHLTFPTVNVRARLQAASD
jgi:two-component system NtrC family sensor kinase